MLNLITIKLKRFAFALNRQKKWATLAAIEGHKNCSRHSENRIMKFLIAHFEIENHF